MHKRIPNVQLLPSAPIATNPCWQKCFYRPIMRTWAKNCPYKVVRNCKKMSNEATKPILKSRPMSQKIVQQSNKTNSQKSSDVAKSCPTKQQN